MYLLNLIYYWSKQMCCFVLLLALLSEITSGLGNHMRRRGWNPDPSRVAACKATALPLQSLLRAFKM